MALLLIGIRVHGLRGLGDLFETRGVCSLRIHRMAGIALCADVATNGSRVFRHGSHADSSWMVSSLTRLIGQQAKNNCNLLVIGRSDEGGTNMKAKMKEDLEDIPMAYLGYVILAILAIAVAALVVVIQLF